MFSRLLLFLSFFFFTANPIMAASALPKKVLTYLRGLNSSEVQVQMFRMSLLYFIYQFNVGGLKIVEWTSIKN